MCLVHIIAITSLRIVLKNICNLLSEVTLEVVLSDDKN